MPKTLAIDITADSIRVVEGEKKRNQLVIHDGFELVPPKLTNGELDGFEDIVENLLDTLDVKKGKNESVNILFPSKSMQNYLMQIPIIDDKNLKKSMPAQFQQQFGNKEKPISSLTHCMDYGVYGIVETEKSRLLSVLMSVIGKDVALRCIEPFNKNKFRVQVIETPVNNLHYVEEMAKGKKENIDLVIHLLNYETNILFFQKGKPIFHRSLKFGLQNMLKDRDGFFSQIFRTIETVRNEYKVNVMKVLLIGMVTPYFGVTGTFQEILNVSGTESEVEVKEWGLDAGETFQGASITLVNQTDIDFDSTYATTLALLAREVM